MPVVEARSTEGDPSSGRPLVRITALDQPDDYDWLPHRVDVEADELRCSSELSLFPEEGLTPFLARLADD